MDITVKDRVFSVEVLRKTALSENEIKANAAKKILKDPNLLEEYTRQRVQKKVGLVKKVEEKKESLLTSFLKYFKLKK